MVTMVIMVKEDQVPGGLGADILPSPIIACEQSVGRERGDISPLTNPPPLLHVSNQLEEKGVIFYPFQSLPHYCM